MRSASAMVLSAVELSRAGLEFVDQHFLFGSAPLSCKAAHLEVVQSSCCLCTQLFGLTCRSVERSTQVRGMSSQTTIQTATLSRENYGQPAQMKIIRLLYSLMS